MANEYKLSLTGSQLSTKIGEIDKKVSVEAQSLTTAQKTQARTNIGAVAADEVSSLVSGVVKYTSQSLTAAQKTQARTNIGAAMNYSYGTEDLEAGVTELESGKLHFVYE